MEAERKNINPFKGFKSNQKAYIFLVCLFIAALWWFLNAFSKDGYQTTVTYPIRYAPFDHGKVVSNKLPARLGVQVQGHGFSLLSLQMFGTQDTLVVSEDMITTRLVGNRSRGFLTGEALYGQFSNQLGNDLKIVGMSTDSIYFDFDRKAIRNIPVKPQVEVNFAPSFGYDAKPIYRPLSVRIEGPSRVVDTMRFVATEPLKLAELAESKQIELPLVVNRIDRVKYGVESIAAEFSVAKLTEKQLEVPIELIGGKGRSRVKLFPRIATVKLQVPITLYNSVSSQDLKVFVDYQDLLGVEVNSVRLQKGQVPAFCDWVSVSPEKIEFLFIEP